MKSVCVVGTDTGVGKTVVSCGLAAAFLAMGKRVAWQKWVATGLEEVGTPSDLEICKQIAPEAVREKMDRHLPCGYGFAASPHLAAEKEGRSADVAYITKSYRALCEKYERVVVEGVGGLMVPLSRELLLIEYIKELAIPVVLVAKSGLGTINHTLLSLQALQIRSISVLGVIFSDESSVLNAEIVGDNMRIVEEMGGVNVLGRLPRQPGPMPINAVRLIGEQLEIILDRSL